MFGMPAKPSWARAAAHLVQTGLREIRTMAERRDILPEGPDSESEFATDVMARMYMIAEVCHGLPPIESVEHPVEREMQAAAALSLRWRVSVPDARLWITTRLEQLGPQYRDMTLAWGPTPASPLHARREARRKWAMLLPFLFSYLLRFPVRERAPSAAEAAAGLVHHGILEIRLELALRDRQAAELRLEPDLLTSIFVIADLCHEMTLALAEADVALRARAAAGALFRRRHVSSPAVRRWMDDRLIEHFIPEFLTLAKSGRADDSTGGS